MKELLARLGSRPGMTIEMIAASFLANFLALASPIFVIQVLNRYVSHGVDATLETLTAGVVMAIVLELGFRQIRMRIAANVNSSYDRVLINSAFSALTSTTTVASEKIAPGIRQEMIAGTEKMQAAYSAANISTILDVPFALMFIGVLYLLNPTISMVVAVFIVVSFLLSVATQASLRRPSGELQMSSGRKSGLVAAAINSGDTVRAFNAGGFIRDLWQGETASFQGLHRMISQRQGLLQSLGASIQALMGVGVIGVGALLVVKGEMDVGAMIGANILAARALGPILKLATLGETFAKAGQALNLLREYAKVPRERGDGTALVDYKGGVEFKDFAFAHPGDKTPLFESMNLTLEPGTGLVFSGSNGTGKTTLARLLVGLLEPSRGRILVDGVDLQQIAPEWWRSQISYLPQEPSFINASIADNLKTVNPQLDHQAMSALIDKVGLRSYIDHSTKGLDTKITNGGQTLSLGIRRRLALARALATNGKLLLIDEPTEGLDSEGATMIFAVIDDLAKQGHTILIFSHDPNIFGKATQYVDLNSKPTPNLIRRKPENSVLKPYTTLETG